MSGLGRRTRWVVRINKVANPKQAQSLCGVALDVKCDVSVVMSGEEAAAIEGWRVANGVPTFDQAARELVRLGLLSEISKAYGVVSAVRESVES